MKLRVVFFSLFSFFSPLNTNFYLGASFAKMNLLSPVRKHLLLSKHMSYQLRGCYCSEGM